MMRVVKNIDTQRTQKEVSNAAGSVVCLVLMIHMDISTSGMTLC